MIQIQKSVISDSERLFNIIVTCKTALESQGIYQWTAHYPALSNIELDILSGSLYQVNDKSEIVGIMNINTIQEEEYQLVEWQYPEKQCIVIHRLAINPKYEGKGYAQQLMQFAEDYGKEHGFNSVRLDAYSGNQRALRFYEHRNYVKRGEIYFPNRELPFYCYEKKL